MSEVIVDNGVDIGGAGKADSGGGGVGNTRGAADGNALGSLKKLIMDGLLSENPTFRLILGTCPVLAVTTSVSNGVGMGISATAVLICSNIVISLIRNQIPATVRIPAFITVIAGFVTIVDLLLHAFTPGLYSSLGIFIPLIVVNCIILARAEMFASKNGVLRSAADGLGMGAGFTCALIIIGSLRELLGNGTWFGIEVTQRLFTPAALMLLPPGGFMAYGAVMAVINKITAKKTPVMSCEGCMLNCGLKGGAHVAGAAGGTGSANVGAVGGTGSANVGAAGGTGAANVGAAHVAGAAGGTGAANVAAESGAGEAGQL